MKKGIIVGVAVAAVICAAVLPRFMGNQQFAEAVALPVMETAYPRVGDIRLTTSLIGKVEPSDVVYIYPKAAGDVTAVNVKAGDIVTEGQVICTIDTKQVETAKSSMDAAALTLREAQDELARQQILYNSGGISVQAYEQYRNKADSARIQYEQAEFTYKTQLEYSQITAPISGLVEICDMEVFDTVSQSNLICVISGQGERVVSFSATERIRGYLGEGDEVEVEKEGVAGSGTIYEVSTMADSTTGLYKVKARLQDGGIFPTGSEVKLHVVSEKTEDAMTIPVDSVYYDDGKPYVYTCDNGPVHKVFIETGIYDSETIEVLSGLTMEDQVITTWSSELYEGAQVRVLGEEARDSSPAEAQTPEEAQTQTTAQTAKQ